MCFFTKSVKNFIVSIEIANALIPAVRRMIKACGGMLSLLCTVYFAKSKILSKLAELITGIAARKENLAASSREIPSILAPRMVAPERDVPGIMASA